MAFKYSTAEAVYPIILGCVCGIVLFANLGSTPFYDKGERFQLLAWDTDVLLEKLKRTDDYIIVGEKESKTVTAYSSLSFTPLLRNKGTGPDRDNPLLLVRGAKS